MNIKIVRDKITKSELEAFKRDCFYMANLGSEIQRVFVWKEKGDKEAMENAYRRAVSIIDKIKSFGNKSANTEMDILQKSLDDFTLENKESFLDRSQISSYFNPFALRVMSNT